MTLFGLHGGGKKIAAKKCDHFSNNANCVVAGWGGGTIFYNMVPEIQWLMQGVLRAGNGGDMSFVHAMILPWGTYVLVSVHVVTLLVDGW